MLARSSVEAGLRQAKTLDRFPADDMRLDNFIHVGFRDISVPDGLRIDHNVRPMLALIEASGLVGTDSAL